MQARYDGPLRTRERALSDRFRFWRGASGRRYAFSVFSPTAAPAYAQSIALYVRRGRTGPEVIAIAAGAEPRPAAETAADEVHLHLIDDRLALAHVLGDLAPLAYSRAVSHSSVSSRMPRFESSLAVAST